MMYCDPLCVCCPLKWCVMGIPVMILHNIKLGIDYGAGIFGFY